MPANQNVVRAILYLVLLVGLGMAGVGAWIGVQQMLHLRLAQSAAHWTAVDADLSHVNLRISGSRRGGQRRFIECDYRYTFQNVSYTSNRATLTDSAVTLGQWRQALYERLAAAHDEDRSVTCYVNPADPTVAVLDRDLRLSDFWYANWLALAFFGSGVAIIVFAVRRLRREAVKRRLVAQHPNEPWNHRPDWATRAVQPQPSAARDVSLAGGYAALISVPVAVWVAPVLLSEGGTFQDIVIVLLALLGPLILLTWATVANARRAAGVLELAHAPIAPGDVLRGAILVTSPRDPPSSAHVLLEHCHTTTRGKSSDVEKKTYFESQVGQTWNPRPDAPTQFDLVIRTQDDWPVSDESDLADKRTWRLTVTLGPGRLAPRLAFQLPIFQSHLFDAQ